MSLSYTFEQDVETVFNLLTDPDFLVDRSMALGELEADCDVEDYEDKTVVKMRRVVTRDLPAFLAKLFNPKQTLELEETWNKAGNSWEGSYKVNVDGQPVSISASFSLKPAGEGCVYQVSHKCKANLPLVGGKVEKFILSQTSEGATEELDFAKSKLTA